MMKEVESINKLASQYFDLVICKLLTSSLSLSKHLAHNLGDLLLFFFTSRRRHTRSVSAFLLNRSSDLNGRLHFHAVHFMRTLPTGSVDPNFGRRVRNRRQLNSLQNTWPYGYSMPIAVRYTQDAFSRSGWLWPVDAKGEPLKATSYMAVGFYVAKYVNKKSDMDLAAKGLGAKEWNNSLKTKLSLLP